MTLLDVHTRAAPLPGVDPPSCQLLGPTALVVQALMGVFVILSLVYKRHRETPKRPWKIWLFDVSKQVVGQLFVHGTNLLISGLVSHHTDGNACVSYFLNILIDTTFGILLLYVTLHSLTHLFTVKFQLKGFESGVYGNPPSLNYWIRQAALYILSLTTMKAVVIAILAFVPAIYDAGEWLLSWTMTGDGDDLQVVFVMGIFPIIMNVLQFWIIDSIVKASSGVAPFLDLEHGPGEYQDREPLFRADSEDGEDDVPHVRHSSHSRGRSSISSVASHEPDDHSLTTDTTHHDEHKSSASSAHQISAAHNYPPSLSSSFSSVTSSSHPTKEPREAKNLQKKAKRRDPPTPLLVRSKTHSSPSSPSMPRTPSPKLVAVAAVNDHAWTEPWDDPTEWDNAVDQKQNTQTHTSLNTITTHTLS